MLDIDASTLEGGGQLTRLALTLSALTLTPSHLTNIRANRGSFRSGPRTAHNTNKDANPDSGHDGARDKRGGTRGDWNNEDRYVDKGKERGRGRGNDKRAENGRGKSKEREKASGKGKVEGGLKESHLAALHFLAEASDALVEGDEVGSREVVFRPRRRVGVDELAPKTAVENGRVHRRVVIELKKPGSVWLIWQALYPYIVFGLCRRRRGREGDRRDTEIQNAQEEEKTEKDDGDAIEFILRGGTNVDKSMSLEYVNQVFLPMCRKIGLPGFEVHCVKRGWAGGHGQVGEVRIVMDLVLPAMSEAVGKSAMNESAGRCAGRTLVESDGCTIEDEMRDNKKAEKPKADKIQDHPFTLPPFSLTHRGTLTSITINVLASTPALIETVQARTKLKLRDALDLYSTQLGHNNADNNDNNKNGYVAVNARTTTTRQGTNSPKPVQITTDVAESSGHLSRLYILLVGHTSTDLKVGHDYLGGKTAKNERELEAIIEKACTRVVDGFMHEIRRNGVMDEFMEDQLVVFQGLARGRSVVGGGKEEEEEGSLHTRTARWVAGEMLEGLQVDAGSIVGVGMNAQMKEGETTVGDLTGKVGGLRIE